MEANAITDLSKSHQLLGSFFKWPSSVEEWEQYQLSKDQIDFYNEYGYVSSTANRRARYPSTASVQLIVLPN
jgi:hypothetical protein